MSGFDLVPRQSDWMAPWVPVLVRAAHVYDSLGMHLPFGTLRAFATRSLKAWTPQDYEPHFFRRVLQSAAPPKRTAQRRHFNAMASAVDHVERAVAYCLGGLEPSPKPSANYMQAAIDHLDCAERVAAAWAVTAATLRESRRRGGIACHASSRRAHLECARLIRVCAPETGWLRPCAAARAIEAELAKFIEKEGIPLKPENLLLRIREWIRIDPAVRAAFQATRRPRNGPNGE